MALPADPKNLVLGTFDRFGNYTEAASKKEGFGNAYLDHIFLEDTQNDEPDSYGMDSFQYE